MRASLPLQRIVAVGCAVALLLSACDSGRPKRKPKPPDEDSKPKTKVAGEKPEVPPVIDVDPSKLEPSKKASYNKGYAQGLRMASDYRKGASKDGEPSAEKMATLVQDWLQERDLAIQAALVKAGSAGADDSRVLEACGRKAGFKEGLAKQGAAGK
jgi:hypothetical protein